MDVIEAIQGRRTTKAYRSEAPERQMVEAVLEAAVWAPNHRLTEPWEFIVVSGEALKTMADLRASATRDSLSTATEVVRETRGEEARAKVLAAPVSIVVAVRLADNPLVRDEDYAATAAAIQNLLLAAHSLGLAAFWGTGILTSDPAFHTFIGLAPDQRIAGIVQLGYAAQERRQRRTPAAAKTRWLT